MAKNRRKRAGGSVGGAVDESEALKKAPHSFVIKRGQIGKSVNSLLLDVRKVLEPFTASNLKVKKQNVVRDFVSVAGLLNVSHILIFTKTIKSVYLRVCRLPHGPTLTFRVPRFCLSSDVIASLRKPLIYAHLYQVSPLLVMNGFSGGEKLELKLITSMFRNMFPSIDVNKVDLNTVRRTVLLNYEQSTGLIEFRHYAVRLRPVGLTKTVKKLITKKRVPDLGKLKNLEQLIEKEDGYETTTESEGEADERDEARQVVLPQSLSSKGNVAGEKSAIRLVEIGPRFTLELLKVESGLLNGEVLYHRLVKKSKSEIAKINAVRVRKQREKMARKRVQLENVRQKRAKLQAKTSKKRPRRKELAIANALAKRQSKK